MDRVFYVLIGMMAGSIITVFLMALLSVAKKEDESLEKALKNRLKGKAEDIDKVGTIDTAEVCGTVEAAETVDTLTSSNEGKEDPDTVGVVSDGNILDKVPGELIDWDTYFNGKHPLDT